MKLIKDFRYDLISEVSFENIHFNAYREVIGVIMVPLLIRIRKTRSSINQYNRETITTQRN